MNLLINCVFIILYFLDVNKIYAETLPCNLRETNYGSVCVCDNEYCDYLDERDVNPNGSDEFIIISSSKGGLRFSQKKGNFNDKLTIDDYSSNLKNEPLVILKRRTQRYVDTGNDNDDDDVDFIGSNKIEIKIDKKIQYQKIVGFGGALTGAVSFNLDKLTNQTQNHVFRSYFSKTEGIAYNFLRIPIGGCDFDLKPWAYNEEPKNDATLSNFKNLDPSDEKKIEQLQRLKEISKNDDIKLMGAAWSPPPWMKTNNDWSGYGLLKKEYYQTWADYHLKYLELMDSKNISFWAISTGNEPLNGIIGWLFVKFMSLGWYPQDQGIWLGQNLGPTLKNSKFKNLKLFGNDDQRYTFPIWFKRMESKQVNSTSYLDGLAVHWYWDNLVTPSLLDQAHEMYKNKIILNTESCVGDKPTEFHGPELGSWKRGEKYARYYMQNLHHWVNGWIDWNIILNEVGGPNYVKNHVDSPVIINSTTGSEIYKQPIFYSIGHYSKFLHKDSIRLGSSGSNKVIDHIAFQRPDNKTVIILLNRKSRAIDSKIFDNDKIIEINMPPKSLHTIIYM